MSTPIKPQNSTPGSNSASNNVIYSQRFGYKPASTKERTQQEQVDAQWLISAKSPWGLLILFAVVIVTTLLLVWVVPIFLHVLDQVLTTLFNELAHMFTHNITEL